MSGRPAEPGPGRTAPFFDQGIFLLHLNRGKEELRLGRYEEARREFEDARRFRPQEPEVLANLGFTLFHLGHYEDAETITRDVLSSFPSSVPLLFNLGLILFKAGRFREAREPLEKVIQIAPAHRKAHLTLALVFQKLGLRDLAAEHFRAAGAERIVGGEEDDTLSRLARAAVSGSGAGKVGKAEVDEVTTPIVKPEQFHDRNPVLAPVEPSRPPSPPAPDAGRKVAEGSESAPKPSGPFVVSAGGLLSAKTGAGIVVRQETITGRRGFPVLEPETSLSGPFDGVFLRARGDGILLLTHRNRQPYLIGPGGGFLSVDPSRVLAFESTLGFREDPSFEFRSPAAHSFLKFLGDGVVALAVDSQPERVPVSIAEPLLIAAANVVAYVGDLDAEPVEPSARYAELGDRLLCRFTGNGTVVVDAG
jgi:Tetratricopeptide repeat/Mitochondrial biogenesis AIM24